jgi:Protein of unknown function (DUF4012)
VSPSNDSFGRDTERYLEETRRRRAEARRERRGGGRGKGGFSLRSTVVTTLQLVAVLVCLAIVAGAWIFIHALDATGRLADARTDIQRIRADLLAGQNADYDMRQAQRDAAAARKDTHDVVWGAADWLPPIKTIRGITVAVNTLAQGALPEVVQVGSRLSPGALRVAHNQIALHPLIEAAPAMRRAAAAASLARSEVADLPSGWIGLISTARSKVLAELGSLSGSVDDVARFATVGPAMLGQHGMRRYFVGIQNNAESRATGGLVAAYAVVTADHGVIRVAEHGNDSVLQTFTAPSPVTTLNADYEHEYGNYHPAQSWITSNVSPDFPDAGQIWTHLWEQQSGEHIDGAFGVDPVGLAEVLGTVGSVTLPGYGQVFTGSNLASFIESTEYTAFPGLTNPYRKNFLSTVGTAVLHKMLSGSGDPQAIASAIGEAAGQGHLALWSRRPAEQAEIIGTPLAGALSPTTAPFASVSVDNATGSKLDYYLDRTLSYQAGGCSSSQRSSTITVTLDNQAPRHGLPDYVRLLERDNGTSTVEPVPDSRLFVFIHATAGAALQRATLDGKVVAVGSGLERGHPVYLVEVLLHPDAPRTIELHLTEPTTAGAATTQVQPLYRPQRTRFDVPRCS